MSIRIKLHFREFQNEELLRKGLNLPSIRLLAWTRFKIGSTWSWPYEAIVDTGAPVCLVPRRIWSKVNHEVKTDYLIRGIVPKEECALPVKVGSITIIIFDEQFESPPFTIPAHLAPTNDVPLILGFKGLLEEVSIYIGYREKDAYIKIQSPCI